jgi:hypothetical protein
MAVPNIPNNIEGWGRVNVGTLFDAETERITLDQSVLLTELDETITSTVRPADPSRPLKVSLAWSDAPGAAGAAPALVNDLDLLVTSADGTTFRGNVLIEGVSVAGGEHDRLHNIENVFLPDPEGTYTVTVTAAGLPGDGDPFRGDQTDQDFALVISNAVAVESE